MLEDCRAGGGYRFGGVGLKEDVIQIVGRDELHANLPLGAAKFEAGLDRSSAIDVALVTVGIHRALRGKIARADLEGECEGATHFVRAAFVGAFAVGTGTRGHVGTVAEVFKIGEVGGSSTSEQQSLNRDGDLAACAAANPLDEAPPNQCQSLLRIELVALFEASTEGDGHTSSSEETTLANMCTTEGFVWDGKKCTKASEPRGYRCSPQDPVECRVQCELGNADSCYSLANLTMSGKAGGPADPSAALYAKACEGDNLQACSSLTFASTGRPRASG